jgi:predicted nucleotidyltransferase
MKASRSDLGAIMARLAVEQRIGTIGLSGSFARGDQAPGADVDVIVTVPFARAERFGRALAAAADRGVHLHSFDALPWHHPYHLCVRWLNCRKLPLKLAPRGAVIRAMTRRDGRRTELCVPVERIPHFAAIDTPLPATPQPGSRFVSAPPLGGFLL